MAIFRRLVGAFVVSCLAVSGWAQELSAEQKTKILADVEGIVTERAFVPGVDFTKWKTFLESKRTAIDEANDVGAFTRAVNQTLREFGLSHMALLNPRSTVARTQTTAVGPGMSMILEEKGLRVRSVLPEGPAKAAGIAEKDVIVTVNGTKPTSVEALNGEKGAKFKVEIENEKGEKREIEIELKEYSTVRKNTVTWFGEDAAVLRVNSFTRGYERNDIEALVTEASKAKYLILDLRSNGGGAVNNLRHLLSCLMPDNTPYGTFISRTTAKDFITARPSEEATPEKIAEWAPVKAKTIKGKIEPFMGSLAVLINRGSASASEITAAALQELRGAKVIGTKTAGAVLASVFRNISDGFSVQYPVSDYVTIKGKRLEKGPVVPDVEVTAVRQGDGPDPVIEKALEVLRGGF